MMFAGYETGPAEGIVVLQWTEAGVEVARMFHMAENLNTDHAVVSPAHTRKSKVTQLAAGPTPEFFCGKQ
jgi:hypothetical protein